MGNTITKRFDLVQPRRNLLGHEEEAKNLGDTIKFYRQHFGYTQADLGRFIEKDKTYISKVESSSISPKYEVLQKVAEVFGLRTYELLIKSHLDNGMPEITTDMTSAQIQKISEWIENEVESFRHKREKDKLKKINPN